MKYADKKIGVWGYGIVGKSAVRYFSGHGAVVTVMDANAAVEQKIKDDGIEGVQFYLQEDKDAFFFLNDFIFVSAAIDITIHYATIKQKFINELDFFYSEWKKPIIAITGTIGKTSITTFLSQILIAHGLHVAVGGNIGVGCLDFLDNQNSYDCAVLEVSSFQLEYCQSFAPTLSIWTNFFPNHLDRHPNEQAYFDAKYNIMKYQLKKNFSIIPLSLYSVVTQKNCLSTLFLYSIEKPLSNEIEQLENHHIFYIDNTTIMHAYRHQITPLVCLPDLPTITLPFNWIIISAALYQLNISVLLLPELSQYLTPVEHRIEQLGTINDIDFYNDSKSTTPQATLAAVATLQAKPIHLLLGGLSKGIDRKLLLEKLVGKISVIYCFGKEAEQLYNWCISYNIPARVCTNLDDAFYYCIATAQPGDQVLLSPSGSSYDLFKNYEERGTYFKKLVNKFKNNNCKE